MKSSEIEARILKLKDGERIELANASERTRAYSAARSWKRAGKIDFEITCFQTERGFVAMRKPK